MTLSDHFWSRYLSLQRLAADATNTQLSLVLEGALTSLLERAIASSCLPSEELDLEINRSINTIACREKVRARVRARHHSEIERLVASEEAISAVILTEELRQLISREDWEAILGVAMGWSYQELAGSYTSPSALRVRVSRARATLRAAA